MDFVDPKPSTLNPTPSSSLSPTKGLPCADDDVARDLRDGGGFCKVGAGRQGSGFRVQKRIGCLGTWVYGSF